MVKKYNCDSRLKVKGKALSNIKKLSGKEKVNYEIVTRESSERHPIIKSVVASGLINKIRRGRITNWPECNVEYIIFNPIDILYIKCRPAVYFCLEMSEYQVENKGVRNIVRNIIYLIFQAIALRLSKKVIFPNRLRSEFYRRKIKNLSKDICIIPNYPAEKIKLLINEKIKNRSKVEAIFFSGLINKENRGLSKINSLAENGWKVVVAGRVESGVLNPKIDYLGYLKHADVIEKMGGYKYAFVYYSNKNINTRLSASIKIFEYYLSGCKILCNRNPGLLEFDYLIYGFLDDYGGFVENPKYRRGVDIPTYEEYVERYI